MARYRALLAQRAKWVDESKGLFATFDAENRPPTAEESTRLTEIKAALTPLDAELAIWEAQQARERTEASRRVTEVTNLAAEKPWGNFGAFLQAVYRAQIGGGIDPRLQLEAAASGMSVGVGADGGFAVPVEFGAGIEKEMWTLGEVLSRVNERPVDGNAITFTAIDETSRADGARRGGVLGYWVDEGTAPDASRIKTARIEMKLRKVGALGYVTDELMGDALAMAAELQEAFREELLFQVENAIFRGTGAGQPQGFLNAACLVTVSKETGQAAASIVHANLSKMWARLHPRSQANAVWLVNADTQPELDILSIPVGTGALEPRFVSYGPDGILRIKGRPVLAVEYSETLGTVGDIVLVDLSRYRVIRKATGIEATSSLHVRFTQGEQTFRAFYRVDGQPIPRAAITPFKGSATLSPFVALATRA